MKANQFAKNDEGVSAVIGVILMVAITVILAAVIAAFVFGMVGNVKKQYTVSFTITRAQSGDVVITNMGGNDANQLDPAKEIVVSYVDDAGATVGPAAIGGLDNTVGSSATIASADTNHPTHVIVTATFLDGTTQVVASGDV